MAVTVYCRRDTRANYILILLSIDLARATPAYQYLWINVSVNSIKVPFCANLRCAPLI